ncbi:MAG: dTDP-glucose 4,6-dehydratase [Flavobacteriales bacterium]|nr:dTDP-glucose 4,6-dehydratase [Flavobacteriales bacterium]|tara:strand:+ start:2957 stop:4021 length:1065 start_codon:yes stop_codon:yes gene_type:complete
MNQFKKTILITGGAGFIGSHLVRLFVNKYPEYKIVNLDKLTYAGNLDNLKDIEGRSNYEFVKGDICNQTELQKIFSDHKIDNVIHLAAESHVDRSISNPLEFVQTNVIGTVNLLNTAKNNWNIESSENIFYHVSTDEVYGSLGEEGLFLETTPYDPRSPYSASKASSDHFVRAYQETYGLNIKISNCSNNYGSHQFPEKLIPLIINNILNKKPLPIYGKGDNVRDWLHVVDHAEAIDLIFHQGKIGETFNIGGHNERKNIEIVKLLIDLVDEKLNRDKGESLNLITYVKDRAGHDQRYAIDAEKLKTNLGWTPRYTVEQGIEKTVEWYLNNMEWVENIVSGDYLNYYENQYVDR